MFLRLSWNLFPEVGTQSCSLLKPEMILCERVTPFCMSVWNELYLLLCGQLKDKRRPSPSNRSPSGPHHSGSAEEQESPERVVRHTHTPISDTNDTCITDFFFNKSSKICVSVQKRKKQQNFFVWRISTWPIWWTKYLSWPCKMVEFLKVLLIRLKTITDLCIHLFIYLLPALVRI